VRLVDFGADGLFHLGEVLQELKTLRQLGESEHMVALCVDGISVDMATKIRHEQLFVIDRATFDLK